jgi:5-methylcytosine-specific restriction endonuclease McrA
MKLPSEQRTTYDGGADRNNFIKEWQARGYPRAPNNWEASDTQLHHIKPLERGGTNDFWNIVPLHPEVHKLFTVYWRTY